MAGEREDTGLDAQTRASQTDVDKGAREIGDAVGGALTDQWDKTKEAVQFVGDQLGPLGQFNRRIIDGVSPYLASSATLLAANARLMQRVQSGEIGNAEEGWVFFLQLFDDVKTYLKDKISKGDLAAQWQLEQLEGGIKKSQKNLDKERAALQMKPGLEDPELATRTQPTLEGEALMDALPQDQGVVTEQVAAAGIAVDRAPGITGGAITNVANNFGGLMILKREDGTYNSGDWEGRLTVGSEVGRSLLANHREEDANGRKAWIYNDKANGGRGDVLSQEEMDEYYQDLLADPRLGVKWAGMRVIMSAKGGYYEVFENPVQGLRGAIENINSRIVRYGEKTAGKLIAAWAPEVGGEENPVGSEATYAQRIARLVGITNDKELIDIDPRTGEIDPTNWQHMAGVILAMAGHEAGRENAPDISAEVLYEALQASQMATGRVVDGQVTVRFGREDGHGMGDFSLEDVQDLLDRL